MAAKKKEPAKATIEQPKAIQWPAGWEHVRTDAKASVMLRLPAGTPDVFAQADAALAAAGMQRLDMRTYSERAALVLIINGVESASKEE